MREKQARTTCYPRYALPAAEVISLDGTNTSTSNSHSDLDIDSCGSVVAEAAVLKADQQGKIFFIKNIYKNEEYYILISFSNIDIFVISYPHMAGASRALKDDIGLTYPKPVQSVFTSYCSKDWNPYFPFATANEWKMVVLATKQRLGKKIVDDWIKSSVWKV